MGLEPTTSSVTG